MCRAPRLAGRPQLPAEERNLMGVVEPYTRVPRPSGTHPPPIPTPATMRRLVRHRAGLPLAPAGKLQKTGAMQIRSGSPELSGGRALVRGAGRAGPRGGSILRGNVQLAGMFPVPGGADPGFPQLVSQGSNPAGGTCANEPRRTGVGDEPVEGVQAVGGWASCCLPSARS